MTDTPMKVIVDCATGESTTVPLTEAELEQREIDRLAYEASEAERKAAEEDLKALKDSARAKLVAGEPLTEAEAATLII
jgi:glyoxylate carboligase